MAKWSMASVVKLILTFWKPEILKNNFNWKAVEIKWWGKFYPRKSVWCRMKSIINIKKIFLSQKRGIRKNFVSIDFRQERNFYFCLRKIRLDNNIRLWHHSQFTQCWCFKGLRMASSNSIGDRWRDNERRKEEIFYFFFLMKRSAE